MSKKLYPETDIQNIANAIRTLNGSSDTYTVSEMASAIALPENAYYLKESASANPLSITDGEELKCQSALVTFSPKQSGTGDPSPENIRPISGWDSLSLWNAGVNLIDLTSSTEGKAINSSGAETTVSNITVSDYIPIVPNTSYYLSSGVGISSQVTSAVYDKNKTFLRTVTLPGSGTQSGVLSVGNDAEFIRINFYTSRKNEVMLSVGSSAPSTYTPFVSLVQTTKTFGNTIYGGSYDFVSGEGSTKYGMTDLGNLNWQMATHTSGVVRFQANVSNLKGSGNNQTPCNMLCSIYKNDSWSNVVGVVNDKSICGLGSLGGTIAVQDSDYETAEAFKTAMSGVQLCYELATPTEITLTPEDIELLKGLNTLWTDGDTVEMEYWSKSNTVPLLNMLSMGTMNISNINNENNENEVEETPVEESKESLEEIENIDNSENE